MKTIQKLVVGLLYLIPGLVLVGWFSGNVYLKSVMPGLSPMNPLVCISFLLVASVVVLQLRHSPARQLLTRSVGVFLILIGLIMLMKYIFGVDLRIDRIIFAGRLGPNRLAPNTAFNLVLVGLALLLFLRSSQRAKQTVLALLGLNAFIASVSIVGYTYGVKYLFGIPGLNPMALHTAVCFLLVDVALYTMVSGRRRLYITKGILLSLLVGLAIEATVSVAAQQGMLASRHAQQKLVQYNQAQAALDTYQENMLNAETGQRGYLLTGNPSYLAPYLSAVQASRQTEAQLHDALKVSPDDFSAQLDQIHTNTKLKFAELAATVELKQAGKDRQALAIVNNNQGKAYLDTVRSNIRSINARLTTDLMGISNAQQIDYNRLAWIFSFATIFNIAFILSAMYFIQGALRRQKEARAEVEKNVQILSAAKSKDEALLSSIGDGVFALDNNLTITLFNQAASDITGFTAEEAIGKKYSDVLHFQIEDSGELSDSFITSALGGKRTTMTNHTVVIHKNGSAVSVADSAAPIFDTTGKQHGIIVVFRDVSKERVLEKAQDEFVSLTSHQLRTPLTAIRLFIELLADKKTGKLNPKQQDYIEKVHLSTLRMIGLVGDILNLSRIQLGQLKIEPTPTDVGQLIEELVDEIKPVADERQSTILFKKPVAAINIPVDANLLAQIIHNFLSNALRYTEVAKGRITVTLSKEDRQYRIAVRDNGIGVPNEARAKLFQRFYRADNAVKVEGEGSGLGLYLVRMIIENAGGTAGYESHGTGGSTFYVTIPLMGMQAKSGTKTITRTD